MILICGFLAWVAVLGIVLAVISYNNYKVIYVTIGEKIFNPIFVQQLDKNLNESNFITFSNSYFHFLEEIKVYGHNEKNWNSFSNILVSIQDHKITKSELESFSNSVWKTRNGGRRTEDGGQRTEVRGQNGESNNPLIQ